MYSTFSNEIATERVTELRQQAAKARLVREVSKGRTSRAQRYSQRRPWTRTTRSPRPAAA